MRRLLLLTTCFAALASPAAAQWGEAPALELGADRVATCLRDAGGGRVAALAQRGKRFGTALHAVTADGLRADGGVMLGRTLWSCPAAATTDAGAVVTAGILQVRVGPSAWMLRLVAAVRDPGGRFAAPVELARRDGTAGEILATVAAAPDGTVAVARVEQRRASARGAGSSTVRVARRPTAGAFGAPETLMRGVRGETAEQPPALAFDATGALTVAWARPRPARGNIHDLWAVDVATAPAGRPFGAPQRLTAEAQDVSDLALAVAPDGRALLAHDGDERVRVFERTPGGPAFTPIAAVGGGPDRSARSPAVALAGDGGAVVAWRDGYGRGIHAMARAQPGAFGAPAALRRDDEGASNFIAVHGLISAGGPPLDGDDRIRVTAAPGGRAAVGWLDDDADFGPPAVAHVAHATGAAFAAPVRLGSPVRDAGGLVPWLALGEPAVVWADNRATSGLGSAYPVGDGRLHLSRAGAAPADPAPPAVQLHAPTQAIHRDEPVLVMADCAAACDLRATIGPRARRRNGDLPGAAVATGGRATPGRVRLRLAPVTGAIARRDGAARRVVVRATAPGGTAVARRTLRVRVRRRPVPPFRRPLDVRARRAGDDVLLRWRTAGPAHRMRFYAFGYRERRREALRPGKLPPYAQRRGHGDRRFRVRLADAPHVRWVVLFAESPDRPSRTARIWVRAR